MSAVNFWENSLQRREFVGACAAAALAGAAVGPSAIARTAPAARDASESEGVPFSLSVMLWTVYRDLPFEQRLEDRDRRSKASRRGRTGRLRIRTHRAQQVQCARWPTGQLPHRPEPLPHTRRRIRVVASYSPKSSRRTL